MAGSVIVATLGSTSLYRMTVSYKGKVLNGVVVLPPESQPAAGAEVEVTPLETRADDPGLRTPFGASGPSD